MKAAATIFSAALGLWGCGTTVVPHFTDAGVDSGVQACPGPACPCSGGTCTCQGGTSCQWTGAGPDGGASNSLACLNGSQCSGTCSGSCSADCKGDSGCVLQMGESASVSCEQSTCTLSVGVSGSVSCTNGATCHVTCTGTETPDGGPDAGCSLPQCGASCSVSCSGGSTCDLQCPTDPSPRSIPNGGGC